MQVGLARIENILVSAFIASLSVVSCFFSSIILVSEKASLGGSGKADCTEAKISFNDVLKIGLSCNHQHF